MDWNWFFSSVAQSIAALDGTLLAFVIASLMNNQSSHARRLAYVAGLIRHAERLRDAAAVRYFTWYNDRTLNEALDELASRVRDEPARLSPEEYAAHLWLPEYLPKARVIDAIKAKLSDLDAAAAAAAAEEAERSRRAASQSDFLRFDASTLYVRDPVAIQTLQIRDDAAKQELGAEREALRLLRVEVLDSIRNIKAARSDIAENPEASALVRRVLAASTALFFFAVVYPLSFLPVPNPWNQQLTVMAFFTILLSLRGVILFLAVVVFGGLVLILWQANEQLRYSSRVIQELDEWSQERTY